MAKKVSNKEIKKELKSLKNYKEICHNQELMIGKMKKLIESFEKKDQNNKEMVKILKKMDIKNLEIIDKQEKFIESQNKTMEEMDKFLSENVEGFK